MQQESLKQYHKDVKFLESLGNIGRGINGASTQAPGRENRDMLLRALEILSNPQDNFKIIHIAGTSGKGTTTKLLEQFLTAAGHTTGSMTSPFVSTYAERFSVNNSYITPAELHSIVEESIKPLLNTLLSEGFTMPSHHEACLLVALAFFTDKSCEYVVLETGMGGLYDATNIIKSPIVTAVTNIGLDHMQFLGTTKKEIAARKAGIAKPDAPFFTTEIDPIIQKVLEKEVNDRGGIWQEPIPWEKNFTHERIHPANLALATTILGHLEVAVESTVHETILRNFQIPARTEELQSSPRVIIDGAHNPDKLASLEKWIQQQEFKNLHLIVGFGDNKQWQESLVNLTKLANNVYCTRSLESHAKVASPQAIAEIAKQHCDNVSVHIDSTDALNSALSNAKENDLVVITGSFYLCGNIRSHWISEEDILL